MLLVNTVYLAQASAGIKSKNFEKMPDLIEFYMQEDMGLVTNLRYPVERVEELESPEMEAGKGEWFLNCY